MLTFISHYLADFVMVALSTFSYFDTGKKYSDELAPERFYHGFVLGLMVEQRENYMIRSNRESGFGRYDIMLIPRPQRKGRLPAVVL